MEEAKTKILQGYQIISVSKIIYIYYAVSNLFIVRTISK